MSATAAAKTLSLATLALLLGLPSKSAGAEPPPERSEWRLDDYIARVVQSNDLVQAQILATEAARRRGRGEGGIFEPDLTGSAQHIANRRRNTVEQQLELQGTTILDERNNVFDVGIESFLPTGAKVRLGYTLSNFNNNLVPPGQTAATAPRTNEWQSFAGASITQPLLRNAGTGIALAGMRLAALNSSEAFQEYRRQLMTTIAQAETAYWNLYFAQEQLHFLDDSVTVAESIFNDNQEKMKAGKGAELDVREAEAGLALRRTKRNEALQHRDDAVGQMMVLAGIVPGAHTIAIHVSDSPEQTQVKVSPEESWRTLIRSNPDYLIQQRKIDEALLRYGIARNQHLPELNLKGAYGLNGLGNSPNESYDELNGAGFPSWSAGVEFRIPMAGGIRTGAEVKAAELIVEQARLQLHGLENQLFNAVTAAHRKIETSGKSAVDYRTMIAFNENLLKTQRDRLTVGKAEARRVLEVEAGVFEVRQGLAEALVQSKRAYVELQLAEGSVMKNRNLEMTPEQLRAQTLQLLGARKKAAQANPVAALPAATPAPHPTAAPVIARSSPPCFPPPIADPPPASTGRPITPPKDRPVRYAPAGH